MNEESHIHAHHEPNYFARIIEATDEAYLKEAFRIRKEVFVREQFVDEVLEYDEFESTAKHYVAIYNDEVVGTCRWRFTDKGIKLERFAVIRPYRSKGIGAALLRHVLEVIPSGTPVYLHAQVTAIPFYLDHGFVKTGPEFEEAGIKHYRMELPVESRS